MPRIGGPPLSFGALPTLPALRVGPTPPALAVSPPTKRPKPVPARAWTVLALALAMLSPAALQRLIDATPRRRDPSSGRWLVDTSRWLAVRGAAEVAGAVAARGGARTLAGHAEDVRWVPGLAGGRHADLVDPQWDHEDDAIAADAAMEVLSARLGLGRAVLLVAHRAERLLAGSV